MRGCARVEEGACERSSSSGSSPPPSPPARATRERRCPLPEQGVLPGRVRLRHQPAEAQRQDPASRPRWCRSSPTTRRRTSPPTRRPSSTRMQRRADGDKSRRRQPEDRDRGRQRQPPRRRRLRAATSRTRTGSGGMLMARSTLRLPYDEVGERELAGPRGAARRTLPPGRRRLRSDSAFATSVPLSDRCRFVRPAFGDGSHVRRSSFCGLIAGVEETLGQGASGPTTRTTSPAEYAHEVRVAVDGHVPGDERRGVVARAREPGAVACRTRRVPRRALITPAVAVTGCSQAANAAAVGWRVADADIWSPSGTRRTDARTRCRCRTRLVASTKSSFDGARRASWVAGAGFDAARRPRSGRPLAVEALGRRQRGLRPRSAWAACRRAPPLMTACVATEHRLIARSVKVAPAAIVEGPSPVCRITLLLGPWRIGAARVALST